MTPWMTFALVLVGEVLCFLAVVSITGAWSRAARRSQAAQAEHDALVQLVMAVDRAGEIGDDLTRARDHAVRVLAGQEVQQLSRNGNGYV